MKTVFDRIELERLLSIATGIVKSRTPMPILQCVRIVCKEGVATLSASNLETWCAVKAEQIDIEQEGECIVPAHRLHDIVKSLTEATITLESDKGGLSISGDWAKFRLFCFEPKEFPKIDTEAPVQGTVRAKELAQGIAAVSPAAGSTRYTSEGVLFEKNNKNRLGLVATNGNIIAINRIACQWDGEFTPTIIPICAAKLIQKHFSQHEADANLEFGIQDGRFMLIQDDTIQIGFTLVQGNFPPYQDATPKSFPTSAQLKTKEFSEVCRQASLLKSEETSGVSFKVTNNGSPKFVVSSRANEVGSSEIVYEPESLKGEDLDVAFRPALLAAGLRGCGEVCEMKFSGTDKPAMLKSGEFSWLIGSIARG